MTKNQHPKLYTSNYPWSPRTPIHGMDVMSITPEHREAVSDVCLGIFVDMSNAGAPLAEILSACYMSGVQHTLSTLRTDKRDAS